MRGSGELLDDLRAAIERWLQRAVVVEGAVGFAPVSDRIAVAPEAEAWQLDLSPGRCASTGAALTLQPETVVEPIPRADGSPSEAPAVAIELAATEGEPVDLGRAESLPLSAALAALEPSRAVVTRLAGVTSRAVRGLALPAARSFRRAAEFGRPRSIRDDALAAARAVVRWRTEGPLGTRAASRAMRALVETSGLSPSSLDWIGVFDLVPATPPLRLAVDADGKRIRLWYPVGARATGVHRIAAARVRGGGRVHAAVVAPE